jgi:hypothetical protein
VDVSDRVDEAIATRAREHTLLLLGATEGGLLSRLTGDIGPLEVAEKVGIGSPRGEGPRPLAERTAVGQQNKKTPLPPSDLQSGTSLPITSGNEALEMAERTLTT